MPNQNRFFGIFWYCLFQLGALQIFESQQRPEVTGHLPIFWPFFGSPSRRVATESLVARDGGYGGTACGEAGGSLVKLWLR